MILIIISIIITIMILVIAIIIAINNGECGQYVVGAIFLCFLIFTIVLIYDWKRADIEKDYINKLYNTEYTQEQVFWIGDIIEKTNTEIKDNKIHLDIEGIRELLQE